MYPKYDIYPDIYLRTVGKEIMIQNKPRPCQSLDRYTLLNEMYKLKIPIEYDIYPDIYLRTAGKEIMIQNKPRPCQRIDRYTLLNEMYKLKFPIESVEIGGNLLLLFPERVRNILLGESEEKLRYYLGWRKYTISQICEVLTKFLGKTRTNVLRYF